MNKLLWILLLVSGLFPCQAWGAQSKNLKAEDEFGKGIVWAVRKGNTEVVRLMLKAGADLHLKNNQEESLLLIAAKEGSGEMVDLLIENGAEVDWQDRNGMTALMIAAQQGNIDAMASLFCAGASESLTNKENRTAAYLAEYTEPRVSSRGYLGHYEEARRIGLIRRNYYRDFFIAVMIGDVELLNEAISTITLMKRVAKSGLFSREFSESVQKRDSSYLKYLMGKAAQVNPEIATLSNDSNFSKFVEKCSPRLLASGFSKDTEIWFIDKVITIMVNQDLRVNARVGGALEVLPLQAQFYRPCVIPKFYQAVRSGDIQEAQKSINEAIRIGQCYEQLSKDTSFAQAVLDRDVKQAIGMIQRQILDQMGRSLGTDDYNYLQRVIEKGDIKQVNALIRVLFEINLNLKNLLQNKSFHDAVLNGDLKQARKIIHQNASFNSSYTALMIAAQEGHQAVAEILLGYGAAVNFKDENGRTALMIAAARGDVGMMRLLFRAGANPEIKDNNNKTALDWAKEFDKEELYKKTIYYEHLIMTEFNNTHSRFNRLPKDIIYEVIRIITN